MPKLTLVSLQESLPPLGLGYIASYLRTKAGFKDTTILTYDLLHNKSDPQPEAIGKLVEKIKSTFPTVLGISSVTQEFTAATLIAQIIKKELGIPILIGGPHISALPETLPEVFSIGILGEGEETMRELMALFIRERSFPKEEMGKIKGIAFHGSNGPVVTEKRPLIEPLDKIPFPARELMGGKFFQGIRWVFGPYYINGTHILTSRGCPFNCIFCSSRQLWGKARFFSPEYVVSEIEHLITQYKLEAITIYDDLFIASKSRLREMAKLIRDRGINERVKFYAMCHTGLFDEETARLLKEINFRVLSFGFESASPGVLSYLKGQMATVEDHRRAVALCRKYNIACHGMFIIGSPEETREDIKATVRFIEESKLEIYDFYLLTPFPGTTLWKYARGKGLVSEDMDWQKLNPSCPSSNSIWLSNKIPPRELLEILNGLTSRAQSIGYESLSWNWKLLFSHFLLKKIFLNPRRYFLFLARALYHKLTKRLRKRYGKG